MRLNASPKLACGRSVEPEETIRRLHGILDPRFSFFMHEEEVSEHLHWAALFVDDLDFRAMGKGIRSVLSRAGALAEAAEWLTCLDIERLPGFLVAAQDELDPAERVPIEALLSHVATATPPVLERIGELDEAKFWADAWSLTRRRRVKVPIAYAGLISGPNGKASGNTLEEAIEHAALEVFERRAHIAFLRHKMIMPTIDLDTVRHPVIRRQIAFVRDSGIRIVLKDLSCGGVLPCIGALFVDPSISPSFQFHRFFKVGSSFDREEALMRIFTEYAQGRKRDEFGRTFFGEADPRLQHDFRRLRSVDAPCDNFLSAFMFGFLPFRETDFIEQGETIPFDPGERIGDSREVVRRAVRVCAAIGKELFVVDFTDPAIGFPVVQVIVPGYSDVLPFHPASSLGLFRRPTRSEVMSMYD